MTRHLPLVVKNSIRNKQRTVLTLLGIASSLCLLGILTALYCSFK